ncbi:histidine phosphatase family protein [Stenotrophomonas sp. BIGb0135]|uniref:histidine phosphatase family protein n=1 Tax=Stenotrophomonas sp. BIGb0135 TaxID=2940620 RepID=UPI0021691563|nr:histidine phosphatase family protein [Stenotrophomonas sp. BIGb0135]MCS4235386.1 alpha-ribazole phosphatase [Stenotrophomonas sp. BIGb0135]
MILDLIRHASTGRDGHLDGRTDPALDEGSTDALCARYAALGWERVLSSPRQRALATADALALPRGLAVIADDEWEELDFGDWDGQALDALPMQQLSSFHLDPHANPPPHGESWGHFERRIVRGLHRLLDEPDAPSTLIVSHGGPLRMVLSQVCGMPMAMCWALRIDHGTRLQLRVEREGDRLWGELLELQQA